MGNLTKIHAKRGTTYQITLECTPLYDETFIQVGQDISLGSFSDRKVVSVEEVKPPVVTFKPGDIVRRKIDGRMFALGDTGRVSLQNGMFNAYSLESAHDTYTSEHYELVIP